MTKQKKDGSERISRLERYLDFDPGTPLPKLPIVKWLLKYPVRAALVMAIIIPLISYHPHNMGNFNFSVQGINYFLFEVMKAPASMLAIVLTLLGIVAILHRSAVASLQIEKAAEQNTFSNFYKHREEYISHLKKSTDTFPLHIKNNINDSLISHYYKKTFPKNGTKRFSTSEDVDWITPLENEIIFIAYLLYRILIENNQEVRALLYRSFSICEESLRQSLFNLSSPESASSRQVRFATLILHLPGGSVSTHYIETPPRISSLKRIEEYFAYINALKHVADNYSSQKIDIPMMLDSLQSRTTKTENQGEDDIFSSDITDVYISRDSQNILAANSPFKNRSDPKKCAYEIYYEDQMSSRGRDPRA